MDREDSSVSMITKSCLPKEVQKSALKPNRTTTLGEVPFRYQHITETKLIKHVNCESTFCDLSSRIIVHKELRYHHLQRVWLLTHFKSILLITSLRPLHLLKISYGFRVRQTRSLVCHRKIVVIVYILCMFHIIFPF